MGNAVTLSNPEFLMTVLSVDNVARAVWEWRDTIRIMESSAWHLVPTLCYCYNWATNPAALRTDKEHRVCRKLARMCKRRLSRLTGWTESDSGRLIIAGQR